MVPSRNVKTHRLRTAPGDSLELWIRWLKQWPEEDKFQNPPKEWAHVPLVHLVAPTEELKWAIRWSLAKRDTPSWVKCGFRLFKRKHHSVIKYTRLIWVKLHLNLFHPYSPSIALFPDITTWSSLSKKRHSEEKGKTKHLLNFHNLSKVLRQHYIYRVISSSQPSGVLHLTDEETGKEKQGKTVSDGVRIPNSK